MTASAVTLVASPNCAAQAPEGFCVVARYARARARAASGRDGVVGEAFGLGQVR